MSILNLRSEEPTAEQADRDPLDDTPPGLDAIRAWIRRPHPWLRGVWLWIRWIGAGVANAYRFLGKHAGPAAKRLGEIASKGERLSRAATRAGNAVREIGGGFARGAQALGVPEKRIEKASAGLAGLGGAVRRFGGRVAAGGGAAAQVFGGVGRLARAFGGNGSTGLGLLDPPEEREPKQPPPPPRRPEKPNSGGTPSLTPGRDTPHQPDSPVPPEAPAPNPAPSGPPADGKTTPGPAVLAKSTPGRDTPDRRDSPVPPQPPDRDPAPSEPPAASKTTPASAASAESAADRLEGLPEVLVPHVNALRERTPRDVLWPLIFDICSWREWTTPAELARWLSMHQQSLTKRHLGPMTKEGLLELRYPDKRSSPRQAYRARRRSAPGVASGRPRNTDPEPPATSA